MGSPKIDINFKSKAQTLMKKSERGVVALVLKDTIGVLSNPITIDSIEKIPKTLTEDNKEQIKLALKGSYKATKEVLVFVVEENVEDSFPLLLNSDWNYIAIPEVQKVDDVATWVKGLRENKHRKVQAILPNCKANNKGIINFTSDELKTKDKTFSTAQYCSRIAGILASIPLNISATYFVLDELISVKPVDDPDKAIDNGELIIINDGKKCKIGRAVNSLTTVIEGQSEEWKKIKIVSAMDMIYTDIREEFEDSYIGKYTNNYDDKCLFIVKINSYFKELELENILNKGDNYVNLNIEKQKLYIEKQGIKTDRFTDIEIKEFNTGSKLFLGGNVSILDAMEDLELDLEV
ncbi:phage tail sheath subtilisin-like domain-containing protein [Clostridium botulinum]|uniref:phage tail sheath subtilisin-like domain-containing protein n=1 Tax=Clostridium botulinum TaxID=1491 RepID=UPI001E5ED162|nr:phage tail sheath subtilisin-like domain-containing protein [Clostridium botulinum]MCD3223939.1 phage tail sheath protein [Clostridium botulinum C/D]MCD3296288.1 phage tail sheath protein [Clostridium botulinum C/D]